MVTATGWFKSIGNRRCVFTFTQIKGYACLENGNYIKMIFFSIVFVIYSVALTLIFFKCLNVLGKISEIWQNSVGKKKNNTWTEIQTLLNQNHYSKEKQFYFHFHLNEMSWAFEPLTGLQDFTRGVTLFHIIISIIIIIKYQRKLHRSRRVKHSHQHFQFTTVWHQSSTSSQRVHLFCSVHHGWCKFAALKRAR